jgi:crossover junction endodeoxyribonuclease RusA
LSVRLTLSYPVSANRYWATRVVKPKSGGAPIAVTYPTPEAKAYREEVTLRAREAGVREPLEGRLSLELFLYPRRPQDWERRMRKWGETWDDSVQCIDLGNCEKVLSDALQGTVIVNDSAFRRIVLERMEPDDLGARVEAVITAAQPQGQRQADLLPPETPPLPRAEALLRRLLLLGFERSEIDGLLWMHPAGVSVGAAAGRELELQLMEYLPA